MTRLETLRAIMESDPDGKPTEPTDADRARFRAWVIRTYGQARWDDYIGSHWG